MRKKIKEENKIDYISFTAHQLKSPLSAIKLSLEMFLRGDFGEITEEQKEIVKKTLKKSEMLIVLVNDLINIAKTDNGGHSYDFKPVDVEELVISLINLVEEDIKNKKIKLEFHKSKINLPKIAIDREKIYLALQNVVDNAIKYTPKGGNINISIDFNSENIEFRIQDSGIGIPESQKKKLFSKFFRSENAIKTEFSGSGLGLFIVKNIIEAHKGKIWFESQEGNGSTFFISLPIRQKS
jgi:signal transduction histidine kinase